MKLLFDQNISFRVVRKLENYFPESVQVKDLGLENFSEIQIWNYANENNFSIVTFDSVFFDLANLFEYPPKIIWLRIGNRRTDEIAELLISKSDIILEFISNPNYKELACIEIDD